MKFNKKDFEKVARDNDIQLDGRLRATGQGQRVYDYDVSGDTIVTRIKFVYFSNESQIPNNANIYSGSSTKNGIRYTSYKDFVMQIKAFNDSGINNFIDDKEKMRDFKVLTKKEFLNSYSYLTEEEYDETLRIYKV